MQETTQKQKWDDPTIETIHCDQTANGGAALEDGVLVS